MFDALPPLEEVVVHVASYHQDRTNPHNESNWGLGLHFKRSVISEYVVGTYNNSQWRQSVYAGVAWELYKTGPLSFNVMAGGITGYSATVMPVLLPEARLRFGDTSLIVNYVPGIFGFSVGRKF